MEKSPQPVLPSSRQAIQKIELFSHKKTIQKIPLQPGQAVQIMVDGQLYTGQPKIKGHSLKLHRKGNALLLVSAEQSEPLLEIEDFFQPLKADASSHQLEAYLVDAHSLFEAGSSDVMVATLNGVKYITGTESIETLTGTSANETIIGYNGVPTLSTPTYGQGDTLSGGGGNDSFKWLSLQLMNSDAVDKITDFGLKGGSGAGQGEDEADVLDLSALLKGYTAGGSISDFIQAVNLNGKVQVQADFDGKANGSAFEKTWFMTLDNLSVNANNEVLANNAAVAATAQGLTGNVTIDTLVQQMMADSQFKVL